MDSLDGSYEREDCDTSVEEEIIRKREQRELVNFSEADNQPPNKGEL